MELDVSRAAYTAYARGAHYGASKAGILGFTRSLRVHDGTGAARERWFADALSLIANRTELAKNASGVERTVMTESRPPFPPFTRETAIQKIRAAEDAWNSCKPERVSLAYTVDSKWRNRSEFINGRVEIVEFLTRKWNRELDYRLIKELWAFTENRIAVRFAYEWHDDSGSWYRSYGNENWEFDENGLMRVRHASINDLPIKESDRKYHWDRSGPRPADHPSLSNLEL
jgi:uncharacterized protein